jgi:hypothetical protein
MQIDELDTPPEYTWLTLAPVIRDATFVQVVWEQMPQFLESKDRWNFRTGMEHSKLAMCSRISYFTMVRQPNTIQYTILGL